MAGPGPVLYLDVDDEITSAAARVRAVDGIRVALVVPPGSRIATSRINFRLLARDAGVHGRRLAIIAPDAASRALAAAAGLEVFASVAEYEAAMGGVPSGDQEATSGPATAAPAALAAGAAAGSRPAPTSPAAPAPRPAAGRTAAGPATDSTSASATGAPAPDGATAGGPSGGDELRPRSAAAGAKAAAPPGRRRFDGRVIVAILGVGLVGLLVVGGVVGYLLLPSATIVVIPRVESIGPIEVTVTADPAATGVDVTARVVPAEKVPLEVQASGTYPATGERVVETKASGTVRWTNCDPTDSYTIPAATVVRTRDGVAFGTTDSVFLPVAILEGFELKCQSRDVGVEAAKSGTAGNVAADTITVVPSGLNSVVIRVTNRAPTSGGSRETFPKVTAKDVEAAEADLAVKLRASFDALVADPATAPEGTTLFPETAKLGEPVPDGDPATLVGQEVAEFELSTTASGTVVAVDETPIDSVAENPLQAEVDPGYELVEGSVESRVGDPRVVGDTVVFPVTVTALQVRQLDPDELEQLVLGMTPAEAEVALAPYGRAEITITPDWASTIPTYGFRVEVTVVGKADASPAGSPAPASPSTSPAGSGSPASPSPGAS